MKIAVLTLLCCYCCLNQSLAQKDSSTVNIPADQAAPHKKYQSLELAAGYYSLPQVAYVFWAKNKERELYTAKTPNFSGPFNIAFSSFFSNKWEISLSFGMDKIQGRLEKMIYAVDSNGVADTIAGYSNYSSKILTLMVCSRYHWKQQKLMDLYSGVGLGLAFVSNDSYGQLSTGLNQDTYIIPGFQLIFIGIRYGGQYGVFAEAGFGNLGAIHGGISARF